jgi:hypothetical protein
MTKTNTDWYLSKYTPSQAKLYPFWIEKIARMLEFIVFLVEFERQTKYQSLASLLWKRITNYESLGQRELFNSFIDVVFDWQIRPQNKKLKKEIKKNRKSALHWRMNEIFFTKYNFPTFMSLFLFTHFSLRRIDWVLFRNSQIIKYEK